MLKLSEAEAVIPPPIILLPSSYFLRLTWELLAPLLIPPSNFQTLDTIGNYVINLLEIVLMSRRCQLTGKKANNSFAVSHSHRRTKRLQNANLQNKRVWWAEGNRWVKLKLSTKAIKTLETKGLQKMANEAGINLNHY